MPLTLTLIPSPSAEANPETAAGKSKNNRKHQKSKRNQSTSPSPPRRKHQDATRPRRPSSSQNPRQQHPQDDPFSITGYIHEQVNTAVSRIPGMRWLTDTVSHPIIVAREKLDKIDGNLTQRRNNQDGSWLYPKGNREARKKQREIDIDSLKRSHKKKIKKDEKRKMRKTSPEKRLVRADVREMVVYPEKKPVGDSIAFCASPDSAEKLFTIEDVNANSVSPRRRYRPRNLVKVTPSFNHPLDASPFRTKLPTRDEFRFTPRLLRYESERQSGTVCNVASFFDVDDGVIDQEPHEDEDYHFLAEEDGRQSCERRVEWWNKELRKASTLHPKGGDNRGFFLEGYPRRNFRQDVNFIGIEPVIPFSSSEETISVKNFPTRRDLNFVRNDHLAHHVYTSVKPLPEEQVFETSYQIKRSTSEWMEEDSNHSGLNNFSDENFLSMPKYVQVLPSSIGTNPIFSNLPEGRSDARKYPKPRMEDEYEGLFVDQRDLVETNNVYNVESTSEQYMPRFDEVIPTYSSGTSAIFFNFREERSAARKYPKPRMEGEFQGLFIDQHERVETNKAYKAENNSEHFRSHFAEVVPSAARKYPKPRMEDEFQGLFIDQLERVETNKAYKAENNSEHFRSHFAEVVPSAARKYPKPRMEDEFQGLFVSQRERVNAIKVQEMENEKFLPRYDQDLTKLNLGSGSVFASLAELQRTEGKYLKPSVQDEFEGACVSQSEMIDAAHEIEILSDIDRPANFPVFLLPCSRQKGMNREQDSNTFTHQCNVFQFIGANTQESPKIDEEIPIFEPTIPDNISKEVLEPTESRNRTFEIEHKDSDEAVAVNAVWKISGNSGFEQISETGEIAGIGEYSGVAENSGLSENSEFGENSGLAENSGLSENSELSTNSGLDGDSGPLSGNSSLAGNSGPEENTAHSVHSVHSGNSESENCDVRENPDEPERNTNKDLVEENKEVAQEKDENNDEILHETTTVTSDVDIDSENEEKHQEMQTPIKIKKNKRYMVEKLNLLHGNIKKLGSELEELDMLHIDKFYDPPDRNHDRDIGNESSDSQEGCPSPWKDSPRVGHMREYPVYKYGVLPQRKRYSIRDRVMSPSTVQRIKEQKRRARDSSQSHAIGSLASGLFKAIIQNGFGPKPKFSPSENALNSTTNTAASSRGNLHQTASLAPPSSKIKKQVSFASQLSSECDSYSTDGEFSDSRSPSKSSPRLSPTRDRNRDKLDLAVATIIDMPPNLTGNGNDGDSSASETTSMAKTTSGVLYIKHKETPEEILSVRGNSRSFELSYHNFPPLEDDRQSDEAKETASEFELSSSEAESEIDDQNIEGQSPSKCFQAQSFFQTNEANSKTGDLTQDSATGLPRANKGPRWYNRFVLGKRLSRVGPSEDCPPSRKRSTPRQKLVNAALLRATML